MIAIFKKNLFINTILLLPYTVLIRIKSIIDPVTLVPSESCSVLTNMLYNVVSSGLAQSIVGILLVFLIANFINHITIKNRLARHNTLIPGLIFIVFSSMIPSFLVLSSTLVALFFVVWMIKLMMGSYKRQKASDIIFNSGLCIGIASLFMFSTTSFLIALFVGLVILRSFKFVERLQLLIGYFIPHLFMGVYLFYNDILASSIQADIIEKISLPSVSLDWTLDHIVLITVLSLGLLTAIFGYGFYTSKKSIQSQKKIDIIYWVALSSFVGLLLLNVVPVSYVFFLMFPLSIFLAMSFINIRNNMVLELIHVGAILGIFYLHFGQ